MDDHETAGVTTEVTAGRGWAPSPWATDAETPSAPETPPATGPMPDLLTPPADVDIDVEVDERDSTYWPGMQLATPVTTLRPTVMARFVLPAAQVALVVFFAVLMFGIGTSSEGSAEADPGSSDLLWTLLILVPMAGTTAHSVLRGLLAKVEISPDRIRVTRVARFEEIDRSSVAGVHRRRGRDDFQHLLLHDGTDVIKGWARFGSRAPTFTEADTLALPGVSTTEIAGLLGVEETARRPRFDGPDAAEVRRDLGTAFWHDSRPGYLTYAVLIAIVLIVACIIGGTAGST